ncbi:unnamed protein product [Penicillium bialowiezense]
MVYLSVFLPYDLAICTVFVITFVGTSLSYHSYLWPDEFPPLFLNLPPWLPSKSDLERLERSWVDPVTRPPKDMSYHLYETKARGIETFGSYLVSLPPGARQGSIAVQVYRRAMEQGDMPKAIIVSPQALPVGWYVNSKDGQRPVEDVIINDLIPHIDTNFHTISSKFGRGIEGFSMGGYGALHLGFKYPEIFGGISAVAPSIMMSLEDEPLERTYNTFEEDSFYYYANGPWALSSMNQMALQNGTSIRILSGADDDRLTQCIDQLVDHLHHLGIKSDSFETKGAGHDFPKILAGLEESAFSYWRDALKGV